MKNNYEIRGDVTAIFLVSKGLNYEALIDTNDLGIISAFEGTWYLTSHGYAQTDTWDGTKKTRHMMHRVVMSCPKGMSVDHINHKTLDNRRSSNLRNLTHAQNHQNRKGAQVNNTKSGVRGVYWQAQVQKWFAKVKLNGKGINLGTYETVEEAKSVVEKARSILMPYSQEALTDYDKVLDELFQFKNRAQPNNKTTGIRNVSFIQRRQKYQVKFKIDGKLRDFGFYEGLEQAKKVADEVRKTLKRNQLFKTGTY